MVRASSKAQLESISQTEIRLTEALIKAVPSVSNIFSPSFNIDEFYAEKSKDTNQNAKIFQEKQEEINITVFYEELKESIQRNKDELAARRKERVRQTNIAYYVSLVCLISGVPLVFIGAILIFIGKLESGVLTTISSIISSIVSGLTFVFNKQANDREQKDSNQMRVLEQSYEAMGYISRISDKTKRDEFIGKLVEKHFFGN